MREPRLGDTLDDYCVKCKRITNHNIVSLVEDHAAKVRCCSCYNDHDFRNQIAPPTKKELKKAALLEEALGKDGAEAEDDAADEVDIELDEEALVAELVQGDGAAPEVDAVPSKKPGKAKRAK